jgi:hypothetical protein
VMRPASRMLAISDPVKIICCLHGSGFRIHCEPAVRNKTSKVRSR